MKKFDSIEQAAIMVLQACAKRPPLTWRRRLANALWDFGDWLEDIGAHRLAKLYWPLARRIWKGL